MVTLQPPPTRGTLNTPRMFPHWIAVVLFTRLTVTSQYEYTVSLTTKPIDLPETTSFVR